VREIDQLLGAQQEQLLASLHKGHDELKEISESIHAERGEAQRAIMNARVALQKLEKEMA